MKINFKLIIIVGACYLALVNTKQCKAMSAEEEAAFKQIEIDEQRHALEEYNKIAKEKAEKLKKEEAGKQQQWLKPLHAKDIEAGVNEDTYYSTEFLENKRKARNEIHGENGQLGCDERPALELQRFFYGLTVFNYDTEKLLDINPALKQEWTEAKSDKVAQHFKNVYCELKHGAHDCPLPKGLNDKLLSNSIFHDHHLILAAANTIKANKLLTDLGIAFMRQKIVSEKCEILAVETKDDNALDLAYLHGDYADILLTFIFYLLKEAYEKYIVTYIENLENWEGVWVEKAFDDGFLVNFLPSFMNNPVYATFINNNLKKLMEPKNKKALLNDAKNAAAIKAEQRYVDQVLNRPRRNRLA